MNNQSDHVFNVGDAVLVNINGARVPGVIEAGQGAEYSVRLAQPWADETGNQSDSMMVDASRLDAYVDVDGGGTPELPG